MKSNRAIHCVGVKGIGLSALAQVLAAEGNTVSGSDVVERFPADEALQRTGIAVMGFAAENVTKKTDLVIASNAWMDSAEVAEAKRLGIPVQSYPQALGAVFNRYQGLAVAGSHGKSTTSALLAVRLEALGHDPFAVIGAVVKNWNTNARVPPAASLNGRGLDPLPLGRLFVIEADEYKNAFHHYKPFGAVVTSIDWDHPDIFPTADAYRKAFTTFMRGIGEGGFLVLNGDDPGVRAALDGVGDIRVMTYGHDVQNALHIVNAEMGEGGVAIELTHAGEPLGVFGAALFGKHHAMNIAAVVGVCMNLGEEPDAIRTALGAFKGTVRRFDIQTAAPFDGKPVVIDDYAHHPTEIAATINAARSVFPKRRIRVLFQPHTFSRTAQYFDGFVSALKDADEAGLLKTFGSARETDDADGKSAADLAAALGVPHYATHKEAFTFYSESLGPGDVLIVMGAGDGDELARKLVRDSKSD